MSPIYPHSTRPKHKNYLFKGDNNLKRNSDDRLKTLQTHNQSYLLPISKDSKTLFSTHTSKLQ